MEKIIFLAHTNTDGSLSRATLEGLGAALGLVEDLGDATLVLGLVGEDVQGAAESVAGSLREFG